MRYSLLDGCQACRAVWIALVPVLACGRSTTAFEPAVPSTVSVTGAPASAVAGSTASARLTVTVSDQRGNAVSDVLVTAAAVGGGTVSRAVVTDNLGRASFTWVPGNTVGEQHLTFSAGTISTSVRVPVTAPRIASVTITPSTITLRWRGAAATVTATAVDQLGRAAAAGAVTWTSRNPLVVTVSGTGEVVAVGPGSTTIDATLDGIRGSTTVIVNLSPWLDFSVLSLSVPCTVCPTRTELPVNVTFGVEANGYNAFNLDIAWYISRDSIITTSDTFLANVPGTLATPTAGRWELTQYNRIILAGATPPGRYWIGVLLDPLARLLDGDRSNNGRSVSVPVQVP